MLNITKDIIPRGRANRPGRINPMLYITVHNTDNSDKGADAKAHAKYIKSDAVAAAKVSWHYTVDENLAYQHIPDNETAFHAGDGRGTGNAKSIGVEICQNADGDYERAELNGAELVAILCKQHSIPITNVVQHNKWNGKNCPQIIRTKKDGWANFIKKVERFMEDERSEVQVIVEELNKYGIVTDVSGMVKEITENPNGRLYWLAKKTVNYLIGK